MATIQFQNPSTVDVILDSVVVVAGVPSTNREILVIGDATGANVTLVGGRVPVDNSGVTQPISGSVSITGTPTVDVTDRTSRLLGNVRNQDGSGNSLTSTGGALDINLKTSSISLPVTLAAAVDVSDRAARLLGVVYGSQGQQIKQTATNFNLQVELATGATLYDARQIRALTSADVVTAAQATAANLNATVVFASPQHVIVDSGSVSITGTPTVDVTDRAARLVGVVYGSQAQQIKQTATNFNLQVELATGATLYDARQIRALTSADVVSAVQSGTWNVNQAIGVAGFGKVTDGTNTAAVKAASTAPVATDPALVVAISPNTPALPISGTVSISGTVTVAGTVTANQGGAPWSVTVSGTPTVDVTDRAVRLLGVVYGSQGQQIKQTATNFNSQVELATGATLYDARQIRALTSADVVSAVQSGTWTVNQGGAPWSQNLTQVGGSAVTLGAKTSANSIPVVLATDEATLPVSIAATINVSVQNATLAVTQSTSPWVENVSQFGGNPVVTGIGVSGAGIPRVTVSSDSFPATQAVSVASLPLPVNAAQESGGNLALIAGYNAYQQQNVELLKLVIQRLDAMHLVNSQAFGQHVDPDTIGTV